MNPKKKAQPAAAKQVAKKLPPRRSTPAGNKSKAAEKQKPSEDRLFDPMFGARLTPDEWKFRFARNLDQLVRLIGLSRKDAALQMHVSYRLLRRIITAGVSRADESNLKSLTRIADFFCLPDVDALWIDDLVRRLVFPRDSKFVEKFRDRLVAERQKRLNEEPVRREELSWLNHALGFDDTHVPVLTGPDAELVAEILASSEADTFRKLMAVFRKSIERRDANAAEGSA